MTTTSQRHPWISGNDIERHEWLIEHPKTGMLLVLVPGGKFLAGGAEQYNEGGGKFEVALPAFYVGLHAVTNRQYGKFVKQAGHRAPNNREYKEAGKAEHPVTDVTWDDAQGYCRWAGLRLPSELEWEKAAKWLDGRRYPWGNDWNEKKCRNANTEERMGTVGVWAHASGVSPYGAYQMSGNVEEWCADWYEDYAYDRPKRGDLSAPERGSHRVIRGGSWKCCDQIFLTASLRRNDSPDHRYDNRGFRCVVLADASPRVGE